jgi:hypothetical protein
VTITTHTLVNINVFVIQSFLINKVGWLANDELYMTWKELVLAYFVVLSQNLPGGTERILQDASRDLANLNAGLY